MKDRKTTEFIPANKNLPDWLLEVFKSFNQDYFYLLVLVDKNFSQLQNRLIPELDEKLNEFKHSSTDRQKTQFFIEAIKLAYKAIPTENKESITSDIKLQKEDKLSISKLSNQLAKKLRSHHRISDRLGDGYIDFEHPSFIKNQSNHDEKLEKKLSNLDAQPTQNILKPGEYENYFASLLENLSIQIEVQLDQKIQLSDLNGFSGRKHSPHFYLAFSNHLYSLWQSIGGFIPDNFKLSSESWADLCSCLLDTSISAQDINMYENRDIKRMENKINELL